MGPKKIFLDFDDVLFNTKAFLDELQSIASSFGISAEVFRETYEELRGNEAGKNFCYRFDKHVEKMKKRAPIDEIALLGELENFLLDTERFLFPDTRDFIFFLNEQGFDMRVVSFGDAGFQTNKIRGSHIESLVTEVKVVQESKENMIRALMGESAAPAYFLDDRVEFLEATKKALPNIYTILVQRPEGRFFDKKTDFCDEVVTNFEEAKQLLGNS